MPDDLRLGRLLGTTLLAGLMTIWTGCASTRSVASKTAAPASHAEPAPHAPHAAVPTSALAPVEPLVAAVDAFRRSQPEAAPRLVHLAFDHVDDAAFLDRWRQATSGLESALLAPALDQAMHEARDVGPVLRELTAALGRESPEQAGPKVVEEVSRRNCCLRRGFIAAALDGLADGLDASSALPEARADVTAHLRALVEGSDADCAQAAFRLLRHYPPIQ